MNKEQKFRNNEDLPEDLQRELVALVQRAWTEDSYIRKQQLKNWKRAEDFWHGIQYTFWSETSQQWLLPDMVDEGGRDGAQGPFYDYVINIYKAHGEAVIAALSTNVPSVRFIPDDADNDDDISTAKTYSKISDLIQRHNKAKMLIMKALFTLWNQGIVAEYCCPVTSEKYGTASISEYGIGGHCEQCDEDYPPEEQDGGSVENAMCPSCGGALAPTSVVTGESQAAKTRAIQEILGPIFVKVPYYAKEQADFGYLLYACDKPVGLLQSKYPHVRDKLDSMGSSESYDYERLARAPSTYTSTGADDNQDLRTAVRSWLRPWWFEYIQDEDLREQIKKRYPEGAYILTVGDTYVESRSESMDDYWKVGKAGLSQYIHSDPIGQPLIPVQEIRNILVNLTQETIEHGIPTGYADPRVLDFNTYSQHEARPGMVYPAKPQPGKGLSESFYESSRATLSREVQAFGKQLDEDGQFVVGSFPSIYGGPNEGSSRTASEYTQSRQMALQRLSIVWTFLNFWWADCQDMAVKTFVRAMISDERYVVSDGADYKNIWIKRSEMQGKIGDVEPEGADTFPISSAQKQTLLLKLLELNNEFLNEAIFDSDNRSQVAQIMGYPEFSIPGAAQRDKQVWETQTMIKRNSLIPVDPDVDDHEIHINSLKNFMVSDVGITIQEASPEVYMILKQHLLEHLQYQMMAVAQQPQEEEVPNEPIPMGQ